MLNIIKSVKDVSIEQMQGYDVIRSMGNDTSEYETIRNSVGIFPMSVVKYIRVTGDEAEEALDQLVSKSVTYLNSGNNKMCYFLDQDGNIKAMVTIYKNDEDILIETFSWQYDEVMNLLQECNPEAVDYSCILFEGPKVMQFFEDVFDTSVDYFIFQTHNEVEYNDDTFIVARTGYTGEYGYKMLGKTEAINNVMQTLVNEHSELLVGYNALKLTMYELKQESWELPYLNFSNNMFELDYQWLVDFKKESDYTGKESLFNKLSKEVTKNVVGAECEQDVKVGSNVSFEGNVVGQVIESAYAPGLGKYIVMLMLDKNYAQSNIEMQTEECSLKTISAPYVVPSSWKIGRDDA